jgi:hypothetical protein
VKAAFKQAANALQPPSMSASGTSGKQADAAVKVGSLYVKTWAVQSGIALAQKPSSRFLQNAEAVAVGWISLVTDCSQVVTTPAVPPSASMTEQFDAMVVETQRVSAWT